MPRELCFVPVCFSTGSVGAYEGPELLVDTVDVNLEGVFLGEKDLCVSKKDGAKDRREILTLVNLESHSWQGNVLLSSTPAPWLFFM